MVQQQDPQRHMMNQFQPQVPEVKLFEPNDIPTPVNFGQEPNAVPGKTAENDWMNIQNENQMADSEVNWREKWEESQMQRSYQEERAEPDVQQGQGLSNDKPDSPNWREMWDASLHENELPAAGTQEKQGYLGVSQDRQETQDWSENFRASMKVEQPQPELQDLNMEMLDDNQDLDWSPKRKELKIPGPIESKAQGLEVQPKETNLGRSSDRLEPLSRRENMDVSNMQKPRVNEVAGQTKLENLSVLEESLELQANADSMPKAVQVGENKNSAPELNAGKPVSKTATDRLSKITKVRRGIAASDLPAIGEWLPGPKYTPLCVLQGRNTNSKCCGENTQKIHFEFHERNIKNEFAVLPEFLQKVKGKNVTIMGDSVQKNLFMALAELTNPGKNLKYNTKPKPTMFTISSVPQF